MNELSELREYHDKAMISLAKQLGEDIKDEPRFKWVSLALARRLTDDAARIRELEAKSGVMHKALSQIERLTHEAGPAAVYRIACNAMFGLPTPPETHAKSPGDCKHERAHVECPDCGIDFKADIVPMYEHIGSWPP